MKTVLWIFVIFLIWRIFLFLPLFASNHFLADRKGYEYTELHFYNGSSKNLVNNFLIYPWANFDGVAYLGIAGNGYTAGNARYFPLYPMLIKGVSAVFDNPKTFEFGQFFIAFLLSNAFFFCSLIVFYKLIRLDYPKKVAYYSLISLLIFPTSFFFGSVYTESLFLLLSLLSFYLARKKLWLFAGITGILLSVTRIVGIAIFPVLLWEFFSQSKKNWWNLVPLLFIPVGFLLFMQYNAQTWHDPLFFVHQQGEIRNGRSVLPVVFVLQTVYRYIKILLSVAPLSHFEWWVSLLELMIFCFASIMLFVAWVKKIKLSYLVFALLCFFAPAFSGTFTGLPRYAMVLFPMYIAFGLTKNRFVWVLYSVISILLLFICLIFFSKGYFIA